MAPLFQKHDILQLRRHGISLKEALRQLELFKHPPHGIRLERACTVGDGIITLSASTQKQLTALSAKAQAQGRFLKFLPASGAASRMFQALMNFPENKDSPEALTFFQNLERFAFAPELQRHLTQAGHDMAAMVQKGNFAEILRYLLTPAGLHYGQCPKGLIFFHHTSHGPRTALEEHLVESAAYLQDKNGLVRLHVTVSEEHLPNFQKLAQEKGPDYQKLCGCRFRVSFSVQKKETDTITVDLSNALFRLKDGSLYFHPAGHGALLENLNALKADIVFIKNVDNVAHDNQKQQSILWKKILGGLLVKLQAELFKHIKTLRSGRRPSKTLEPALKFAQEKLSLSLPDPVRQGSADRKRQWLLQKLDRPLRVCGMVKNTKEPGGGPFWVREDSGEISLQIVEKAQVSSDKKQQKILKSSTHFNPVDIVCGLRDWQGKPFDLRRFADSNAVFISHRSKEGRPLKALEQPGLWNGAMAHWNTVFVEVPQETFTPVKTITDLLKKSHLPGPT